MPETLSGSSQRSRVGDTCYLTVSVYLCDGQLRREGARASTLYPMEELNGDVVFNIRSEAMYPQNEQAQVHLSISPSQALVWQVRFLHLVPLHKTGSQHFRVSWEDVGQVEEWPLWILSHCCCCLDLVEPSGTKACTHRQSFWKADCL